MIVMTFKGGHRQTLNPSLLNPNPKTQNTEKPKLYNPKPLTPQPLDAKAAKPRLVHAAPSDPNPRTL